MRYRPNTLALVLTLSVFLQLGLPTFAQQPFPPTEKQAVTDEYHHVKVVDDYRWLEDMNAQPVKDWIEAQNKFSRSWFEKLPARAALAERLKTIFSNEPVIYYSFRLRKCFLH